MILVAKTYWAGAPFHFRKPPEDASSESLVLRADDGRQLRAMYWTKRADPRPRVAVVCMHPRVDFLHHYTFPRLVAAGVGCLGAMTRYGNDDTDAEHESMVLDVAVCIRWLKERRGVERVVLLGNSGGGSLAALHQAEAETAPAARRKASPAGTPTRFDAIDMVPADGLALVAVHRGQGKVLGACIDASVVDEHDPLAVDPELDMYDPRNGFREPLSSEGASEGAWSEYDDAFVARYRAAQDARVVRLDTVARELLDEARDAAAVAQAGDFEERPFAERQRVLRRRTLERVMVVYRTMANPSYVDHRLDPSSREYGSLLSDRPDLMNYSYLGFARTCTPRAWLSTWSSRSSNADLVANVARIAAPTLYVSAEADREIYPRADVTPIAAAIGAKDKTVVTLDGARHYFEPPFGEKAAPDVERLMDVLVSWIQERFS